MIHNNYYIVYTLHDAFGTCGLYTRWMICRLRLVHNDYRTWELHTKIYDLHVTGVITWRLYHLHNFKLWAWYNTLPNHDWQPTYTRTEHNSHTSSLPIHALNTILTQAAYLYIHDWAYIYTTEQNSRTSSLPIHALNTIPTRAAYLYTHWAQFPDDQPTYTRTEHISNTSSLPIYTYWAQWLHEQPIHTRTEHISNTSSLPIHALSTFPTRAAYLYIHALSTMTTRAAYPYTHRVQYQNHRPSVCRNHSYTVAQPSVKKNNNYINNNCIWLDIFSKMNFFREMSLFFKYILNINAPIGHNCSRQFESLLYI